MDYGNGGVRGKGFYRRRRKKGARAYGSKRNNKNDKKMCYFGNGKAR